VTTGPGKYDALATYVRESTGAATAIVMVIEGNQGSGFSVQTSEPLSALTALPTLLRRMADDIEQDLRAGNGT
jgi:hypothetical protein